MKRWFEDFVDSKLGQAVLLILVLAMFLIGLALGANDLPY